MRKTPLVSGEYYHVFNRGVDKRVVFMSSQDSDRFVESLFEFNVPDPIGSLYHLSSLRRKEIVRARKPSIRSSLVKIVGYCLNPNHFHLILYQVNEHGISNFLHKVSTGYTRYFNERYGRTGSLFQGPFKAVHIESNEQLLHVSAYVNLNDQVHTKFKNRSGIVKSSWKEYTEEIQKKRCYTRVILDQFESPAQYKSFAEGTISGIVKSRGIKEDEDINLGGVLSGLAT